MPKWLENAVFYEIYPQSFYDTNADGIGDLPGIIQKLDYIQELGCNALWINPCFDSPFYDAGYDVRDYYKIAPRYGTNEDARRLFAEAHARGIHVLLDLVAGHTSIQHEWFEQSMQVHHNAYSGRYIWADNEWEDFADVQGVMGRITGFCNRGSCAVNFFSTQPALNYGFAQPAQSWQQGVDSADAISTREALLDIMRFWLDMGCDGFRVDMAGSLVKNDPEQAETIKLWQGIHAVLARDYPEAAMISEWGDPKRALAAGFHMDFLLHFGPSNYNTLFRETPFFSRGGEGCISGFIKSYLDILQNTPKGGLVCIPSGNHDMPRIAAGLDNEELKLAFAFLLSMPGAPFIYYGDELGMRYLPDVEPVEGGFARTGSRSPMQWDNTLNAGFSSGKQGDLYIPVDPDPQRPNVQAQRRDLSSLWHEVRRLIALRMQHEALQSSAPFKLIHAKQKNPLFAYQRGEGKGAIIVALNPWGGDAAEVSLDSPKDENWRVLHSIGRQAEMRGSTLWLPPCSCVYLAPARD